MVGILNVINPLVKPGEPPEAINYNLPPDKGGLRGVACHPEQVEGLALSFPAPSL